MSEAASDRRPTPEVVEPGAVIANKYTILRRLAGGAPGSWLGRPKGSEPLVSLHILYPQPNQAGLVRQFEQELPAIAELRHPQLLPVLDFGQDSRGWLFVACEPVEAPNILQLIENDWPLPESRIVQLLLQLLAALEVGHERGLYHGDLQPGNLLYRAGAAEEIMLCSFGLAKYSPFRVPAAGALPLIELGSYFVGTPEYAAPEQLHGEPLDARSDIYAVGLLLFQLLTRTPPFLGETVHEVAWKQCYTPPPPPSGYASVSAELEAICLKALSKTPEIRYQTIDEMRNALLATLSKPANRLSRRPSALGTRPSRTSETALVGQVVQTSSALASSRSSQLPPGRLSLSLTARGQHPQLRPVRPNHEAFTAVTVEAPAEEPAKRGRGVGFGLLLGGCLIGALGTSALTHLERLVPVVGTYMQDRSVDENTDDEPAPRDFFAGDPGLDLDGELAQARAASAAQIASDEALASTTPSNDAPMPALFEDGLPAPIMPASAANLIAIAPVTPSLVAPAPSLPQPSAAAPRRPARRPPPVVEVTPIPTANPAPVGASGAALNHPEQTTAAAVATAEMMAALADPANALGPKAAAPSPNTVPSAEPRLVVAPEPAIVPQPTAAAAAPAPAPAPAPVVERPKPAAARTASPALSEKARVAFGDASSAHGAVSKNSLRAALNHAAFTRCYRDTVGAGQAPAAPLHTELEYTTNSTGRIVSAKLRGTGVPASLGSCVESAARLGRVREVDTGSIQVTMAVSFLPE